MDVMSREKKNHQQAADLMLKKKKKENRKKESARFVCCLMGVKDNKKIRLTIKCRKSLLDISPPSPKNTPNLLLCNLPTRPLLVSMVEPPRPFSTTLPDPLSAQTVRAGREHRCAGMSCDRDSPNIFSLFLVA